MTDVAPGASLLDWVTGLVTDPAAQARFAADPHGVLGEAGLADLDPADLFHAIPLVTDSVAARLDAVADGSAPIPGPLEGESGLDAAVRQLTAIPDRIVPISEHDEALRHDALHELPDHGVNGHAVVDLDDPAGPHDVPDGLDDGVGHHPYDPREIHDLDDRAHDAWSPGSHPADAAADHARPAPAFATGHASHLGVVDPGHTDIQQTDLDGSELHGTATDWHDDTAWHDDGGPHGTAHAATDEGDHHLDEDDTAHHTDTHHDPGAALGAS
jgi:hypothetical protein